MSAKPSRDLRLDFFRGLALFFIFVDHIPDNPLSYFTLQGVAFSDAAEVFIFISGYTAALVYGRTMLTRGSLFASAQVLRRVWQLYVAHIFLFVIFTAEVSYTLVALENPLYAEELRVTDFLAEPHIAILNALALRFQPTFLDILPLYIVLLAVFPLILVLLRRSLWAALLPSFLLYAAIQVWGYAPKGYPPGQHWFFNPLAWQFLFVIGAALGFARATGQPRLLPLRWGPAAAAIAVLAGCVVIDLSWTLHGIWDRIPALFLKQLWPVNKTNLSPLRLINFLALAVVVTHFVRPETAFLRSRAAGLVTVCGRHSLQIFCLGILLSVLAHLVLSEAGRGLALVVAVNLGGIALMIATALLLDWYKTQERGGERRPPAPAIGAAAALALVALLPAAPVAAREPDCSAPPELVQDEVELDVLAARLRAGGPLKIVALGGASTRGAAAGDPARAWPAQLEETLRRRHPGLAVTVANKGIARQTAQDMLDRMTVDVVAEDPQLVLWEVGIADAVGAAEVEEFAQALQSGLALLASHGIDAMVIDMQFGRGAATVINYEPYRDALRRAADVGEAYFFPRWELMRYWSEAGVFDFEKVPRSQRAQHVARVYACLAERLADAIEWAAR
jgi:lysophospholipase L1-like esterase